MWELNNHFWWETDAFFNSVGKNNKKINTGILPTVLLYTYSPLAATTPTS